MLKEQRNKKIQEIAGLIKDKSLVFVDYHGVNVEEFTNLRTKLMEKNALLKVFKNTLTLRALQQLEIEKNEEVFKQMTATAIVEEDQFMASSKDILDAEKNKQVKIKGGVFNGDFIDSDLVRKYANIPSRQDLYGILVATLQQVVAQFVFVLEEIKKQKENQSNEN